MAKKETSIWEKRKKTFNDSYLLKFARMFSYPITVVLSRTPVTPNMVTLFSFILILISSILFVLNERGYTIIAGLIVWFALVFDCVDGELARVKSMGSKFGMWFDGALDRIGEVFILGAISLNVYQNDPSLIVFVVGVSATVSTTLWRLLGLSLKTSLGLPLTEKQPYKPFGFDVSMQAALITAAAILNQLFYLLVFFAVVVNLAWIKNMVFNYVKYKKKFS